MLSEEPSFILFKYSEQITVQTTINFNVNFFLLMNYLNKMSKNNRNKNHEVVSSGREVILTVALLRKKSRC